MEYAIKVEPNAHTLMQTSSLLEAVHIARTTARFIKRPAYVYSPWSDSYFTIPPD